jgi:hypothetical protein
LTEQDRHLAELNEAAKRAGALISEQIAEVVGDAERRAAELRREAQEEAERRAEALLSDAERSAQERTEEAQARAEELRQAAEQEAQETQLRSEEARRVAERDAEDTRHEALESARRVFERINALERPLGELAVTLREEKDRVAELRQGRHETLPPSEIEEDVASAAEATSPEPQVESEPEPEPEPELDQAAEPIPEPEPEPEQAQPLPTAEDQASDGRTAAEEFQQLAARADQEAGAPTASPEEAGVSTVVPPTSPKKRRGFLRRRRSHPFIGAPGECAVCQRSFQADSEEELAASGWRISDDVGLCPDCQADGWMLPEGARLPFRRGAS